VAHAAPGTPIGTPVSLAAASCGAGSGTSLALVSGRLVDRINVPSLLVVSCQSTQPSTLYFIDPSSPSTSAKTITTTQVPATGWTALALRVDKGDLIGCGQSTTGVPSVYKIDISTFTSTPDGTTVKLFDVPPGNGTVTCSGLAWDPNDNTVFLAQDNRCRSSGVRLMIRPRTGLR